LGVHDLLIMVFKLLLAAALGGLIGIERESHGRPAGLRTHVLVALGAALFTIISEHYSGPRSDPSRISAQIVSGIGFLGAGTIIRQGSVIRGLTTAASLWTAAAIGMAAATWGIMPYVAVAASVIVFLTLSYLSRIEHLLIRGRRVREIAIELTSDRGALASVLAGLSEVNVMVNGVGTEETSPGVVEARVRMTLPPGLDSSTIDQKLVQMPEVKSFDWD
jgi:putative Mg2+ transporter-C (MgtC) family protein